MFAGLFNRLAESRLTFKFLVISVFVLVIFALALFGIILRRMEEQLLTVHKQSLDSVVGTVHSLLKEYDSQVRRGDLTLEEAQARAIRRIKMARYGSGDYFWINDLSLPEPKMIMHPTVPALDGKVLSDPKFVCATFSQDGTGGKLQAVPGGKANLFGTLVKAARASGTGFVVYQWPKPMEGGGVTANSFPKLSCGMVFEPWGWLVGSGVYIDSIDKQLDALRLLGLGVLAAAFLVGLVATIWLTKILVGRQVDALAAYSGQVAGGDLSAVVPSVSFRAEIRELKDCLVTMVEKLRESIALAEQRSREAGEQAEQAREQTRLAEQACRLAEDAKSDGEREAASAMGGAAEGIGHVVGELSDLLTQAVKGTAKQRGEAEQTAQEMEEVTATLGHTSTLANTVAGLAGEASQKAKAGSEVVERSAQAIESVNAQAQALSSSMHELGKQSNAIGAILTTIADIADQTNLLALNAAIEAARAGDAGRGFAVVADEVRKLAEKTMTATQEVSRSVGAIQENARQNVERMDHAAKAIAQATGLARESGEVFADIVDIIGRSAGQTSEIASDTESQAVAMQMVAEAVDSIARVAGDIARNASESLEALRRLEQEQLRLDDMVRTFDQGALEEGPSTTRKKLGK